MSLTTKLSFNKYGDLARQARTLPDLAEATADEIVTDAQRRVPVRTGALRDSIQKRKEGIAWLVEATEDYAAFVEYGTRFMAAQPYLTPASEAARSGYVEKLRRGLEL